MNSFVSNRRDLGAASSWRRNAHIAALRRAASGGHANTKIGFLALAAIAIAALLLAASEISGVGAAGRGILTIAILLIAGFGCVVLRQSSFRHVMHPERHRQQRAVAPAAEVVRAANTPQTEPASLELQAAEALHRLEMAEEIAHVGNWRLSLPDETLTWSDEVYRIHGLDKAAFQPTLRSAIAAYHPDDRAVVTEAMSRARRLRSSFDISLRLMRPDGAVRHVLSRGRVEIGQDGDLAALFGVFVDITEQKAIEAALFRAHEDAERANRMLAEMARLDGLTGLANRREFDHALEREFRRAMRSGVPLGLIMIDVDNFKQFNDLYGHPSGDACLRAIAEIMPLYVTRPGDVVARYGGEEIAILLPGSDAAGTRAVAQTLAQAVRDLAIPHEESPGGIVTISAGVDAVQPRLHHDLAAELVERADIALYAAKHAGRNTVRWHGEIRPFGSGALAS